MKHLLKLNEIAQNLKANLSNLEQDFEKFQKDPENPYPDSYFFANNAKNWCKFEAYREIGEMLEATIWSIDPDKENALKEALENVIAWVKGREAKARSRAEKTEGFPSECFSFRAVGFLEMSVFLQRWSGDTFGKPNPKQTKLNLSK